MDSCRGNRPCGHFGSNGGKRSAGAWARSISSFSRPRVIGRFLEHTRIVYFRWGEDERQEALYLSSADWMSRNMIRRIELAWPVVDRALRQRVIDECLMPYLHDRRDAWMLRPDGSHERISHEGPSAQQALIALFNGSDG